MLNHQPSYTKEELIASGRGEVFGPGNARLPLPPMLMFDRITEIREDGGAYGKGRAVAELEVSPDLWFFQCHFESDPVMPGCLGLDAMWQLVGFYLAWAGGKGRGRALGVGEVKFSGQVMPEAKLVRYEIDMKKTFLKGPVLGVADGVTSVDGQVIYQAKGLRVGLFAGEQLASE